MADYTMDGDTAVMLRPSEDGPIERFWMFVTRDHVGTEAVMGSIVGDMGLQPLVSGNPKIRELMRGIAKEADHTVPMPKRNQDQESKPEVQAGAARIEHFIATGGDE